VDKIEAQVNNGIKFGTYKLHPSLCAAFQLARFQVLFFKFFLLAANSSFDQYSIFFCVCQPLPSTAEMQMIVNRN